MCLLRVCVYVCVSECVSANLCLYQWCCWAVLATDPELLSQSHALHLEQWLWKKAERLLA